MTDLATVVALAAKNGEMILGAIVGAAGFLFRRSFRMLDRSIRDIEDTLHGNSEFKGIKSDLGVTMERVENQEKMIEQTDRQISQVHDLLDKLNSKITSEAIKNSENLGAVRLEVNQKIGEVKGDVGECVAMLRLLVDQSGNKR